jgi:hypothetical protein
VITKGHKELVTDRTLISNRFYKLVTGRFNFFNRLALMSITTNSCNERLRSLYQKSTLATGVVEANPGVDLPRSWVTGTKQQLLQMWMHVTSVKGPLQMLSDLFEVFK